MAEQTLVETLDLTTIRLEQPSYEELVLSLVIIWGIGDLVSTLLAAALAGPTLESNPLIRALLIYDPLLVVALKGGVVLSVGIVLLKCQSIVRSVPGWRVWFLVVIATGVAVVVINLYVSLLAVEPNFAAAVTPG